eukprot:CAMPEP_0116015678 /NCGR_PEP_ID=MMETSP0321-20121206/6990_1 /TAXON_ID=163516 /ORGANISM="Leptocylindrus danicus var. danicus, Strain B650" /LENGTH=326 /DNA_ID=CAMNT_0003485515 /DNA_START=67 /DNA_END=1047 /DNA_ORIENTATION=-
MTDSKKDEKQNLQEELGNAAEKLEKFVKPIFNAIVIVLPFLIKYVQVLYTFYSKLPDDIAAMLIGLIFCFFGGLYPTLFAALQAARLSGWDSLVGALKNLNQEIQVILEADKKDSLKDEDGDGIADVNELDSKEFFERKTKLVLTKINPTKVDDALSTIYKVWLGVAAALAIKFARTISLALSLADAINKPVMKYAGPFLEKAVPKEYSRWIPVVVAWITKSIGMSIAWYIQTIISAFTSAIQGGLMTARAMLKFCAKRGIKLGGFIPEDHNETLIDETIGYTLAALGFFFQFKVGFDITFPFNIPLMPFEMAETWLRWQITSDDD